MNKIMRKAKAMADKRLQSIPYQNPACTACNGSGHYDHNGSPPCTSCGGSGKRKKDA